MSTGPKPEKKNRFFELQRRDTRVSSIPIKSWHDGLCSGYKNFKIGPLLTELEQFEICVLEVFLVRVKWGLASTVNVAKVVKMGEGHFLGSKF